MYGNFDIYSFFCISSLHRKMTPIFSQFENVGPLLWLISFRVLLLSYILDFFALKACDLSVAFPIL